MRAELRDLRGTVATLATIIQKMIHSPVDILNKLTPYGLFKLTPIDNL